MNRTHHDDVKAIELAQYMPNDPYKNYYKVLRDKIKNQNKMKRNLTLKFNKETKQMLETINNHKSNSYKMQFRSSVTFDESEYFKLNGLSFNQIKNKIVINKDKLKRKSILRSKGHNSKTRNFHSVNVKTSNRQDNMFRPSHNLLELYDIKLTPS